MKQIKKAIESGEVLIGPFSVSGSPHLVEMIGYAGFDFVIIDCEHASTSPWGIEIEGLLRAAYAADIAPIVRITNNDRGQILKALNLGAQVVVIPHVNSEEDAMKLVESGKYGPIGRRSCAPPVRAAKHGFIPWAEFYRMQLEETILIPIIEEVEGVNNVERIAKVKGLGGIFFGPFDLAVSKGDPDRAFDLNAHDQREFVYSAAKKNGLPIADLAWDLESASMMIEMGAQIIALGTDLTMFADSLRSMKKGVDKLHKKGSQ